MPQKSSYQPPRSITLLSLGNLAAPNTVVVSVTDLLSKIRHPQSPRPASLQQKPPVISDNVPRNPIRRQRSQVPPQSQRRSSRKLKQQKLRLWLQGKNSRKKLSRVLLLQSRNHHQIKSRVQAKSHPQVPSLRAVMMMRVVNLKCRFKTRKRRPLRRF